MQRIPIRPFRSPFIGHICFLIEGSLPAGIDKSARLFGLCTVEWLAPLQPVAAAPRNKDGVISPHLEYPLRVPSFCLPCALDNVSTSKRLFLRP